MIDTVIRRFVVALTIAAEPIQAGSASEKLFGTDARRLACLSSLAAALRFTLIEPMAIKNPKIPIRRDPETGVQKHDISPEHKWEGSVSSLVRMHVHGVGAALIRAHTKLDLMSAVAPLVASRLLADVHLFIRSDVVQELGRRAGEVCSLTVGLAFNLAATANETDVLAAVANEISISLASAAL
jgi:hypothetical protein